MRNFESKYVYKVNDVVWLQDDRILSPAIVRGVHPTNPKKYLVEFLDMEDNEWLTDYFDVNQFSPYFPRKELVGVDLSGKDSTVAA